MPSDLYAERLRITTGSLGQYQWTASAFTGSDPNGVASEPSGSLLRSSDGGIWINSNGGTEWQRLGNGVVTGSYTAAGTEGSQITVTLPVAFASNQYKVFVTNVSGSSVSAYQVPENLRTTTNFKINSTSPFAANDKLDYLAISGSIYSGAGTQTLVLTGSGASAGSQIVARTGLTASASTISVSGLDGDTDREYTIEFNYLSTSTSAHDLDIRPNGDTSSNRNTTRVLDGGVPSTSGAGVFTTNGGVTNVLSARYTFTCFVARDSAITYYRRFLSNGTLTWNLGVGNGNYTSVTVYSSNASNLTSLTIGVTNIQFASGSELIVRKLVR